MLKNLFSEERQKIIYEQGSRHAGRRRPALAGTDACWPAWRANRQTTGRHEILWKFHGKCLKIHENIYYCNIKQPTVLSGHLMQNEAFISPKPSLILWAKLSESRLLPGQGCSYRERNDPHWFFAHYTQSTAAAAQNSLARTLIGAVGSWDGPAIFRETSVPTHGRFTYFGFPRGSSWD